MEQFISAMYHSKSFSNQHFSHCDLLADALGHKTSLFLVQLQTKWSQNLPLWFLDTISR